jgi:2-polyprenyl-3-methyl-5-hydroxy-6-metoxy-1,4-benzoquinol methylase
MRQSKLKLSCVACGGTPLERERAYRPRRGIFSRSSVARCTKCDLLQVVPMPTADQLDAYYRNDYRPRSNDRELSPYEDANDVNFRTLSQAELIRGLGLDPKSIVDVGCGFGLLLSTLRQTFSNARLHGVEISEKCHPTLTRLKIEHAQTTIEREGRNPFPESFDLLVCSHVLEHSGNVPQFLSICYDMVKPGATVFFEVPNCEYEYGADAPHVVFFTPKTLSRTLSRCGFTCLKCMACGPSVERWQPNLKHQLRTCFENRFPVGVARSVKAIWRLVRSRRKHLQASTKAASEELAKLREEAKDPAWFKYDEPGFKHSAIRCVAVRSS